MPSQFPKTRPHKETPPSLFLAVMGVITAGVIYSVSCWGVLMILREQEVISKILSYHYCVAIAYIFLAVRLYDKQLFSKK